MKRAECESRLWLILGRRRYADYHVSAAYSHKPERSRAIPGSVQKNPFILKMPRREHVSHQLLLQLTRPQVQGGHHHSPLRSLDTGLKRETGSDV